MEQRLDMLEREVSAIKADVAVIKSTYWTREDARHFELRLARIEADVSELKADVAQLKSDVAELRAAVVRIDLELEKIRLEMQQIRAEMQHYATKADLSALEARLKTWMAGTLFSTLTLTAAVQIGLYTAFTR